MKLCFNEAIRDGRGVFTPLTVTLEEKHLFEKWQKDVCEGEQVFTFSDHELNEVHYWLIGPIVNTKEELDNFWDCDFAMIAGKPNKKYYMRYFPLPDFLFDSMITDIRNNFDLYLQAQYPHAQPQDLRAVDYVDYENKFSKSGEQIFYQGFLMDIYKPNIAFQQLACLSAQIMPQRKKALLKNPYEIHASYFPKLMGFWNKRNFDMNFISIALRQMDWQCQKNLIGINGPNSFEGYVRKLWLQSLPDLVFDYSENDNTIAGPVLEFSLQFYMDIWHISAEEAIKEIEEDNPIMKIVFNDPTKENTNHYPKASTTIYVDQYCHSIPEDRLIYWSVIKAWNESMV